MKKILLVDDDSKLRATLVYFLKLNEYDVEEAGNISEALARLDGGDIDAVISDLQMPGGNGDQLLQIVKTQPCRTQLPFLLHTGADISPELRALEEKYPKTQVRYKLDKMTEYIIEFLNEFL